MTHTKITSSHHFVYINSLAKPKHASLVVSQNRKIAQKFEYYNSKNRGGTGLGSGSGSKARAEFRLAVNKP